MFAHYRRHTVYYFLAFLLLEVLSVTVFQTRLDYHLNPFLWFVGSLGAGVAGYHSLRWRKPWPFQHKLPGSPRLWLAILAAGLLAAGIFVTQALLRSPIDPMVSDIVPTLKVYVERLLTGVHVYQPIPYEGWTVLPNYLPLVWLPYVPAEWLQLDYRLYSYILFAAALFALFTFTPGVSRNTLPGKVLIALGILALLLLFHASIYIHSVEFTIAACYLLLAMSLRSRSAWVLGAGILLCLLSRYSFTFWLPVFLLMLWSEYGFEKAFRVGLLLLLGTAVIYTPFLWKDPGVFADGMGYYGEVVRSLWQPYYWQHEGAIPFHLGRGLSFSIFFYEWVPGDAFYRLKVNQWVHLAVCAATAIGIFAVYLRHRRNTNFDFAIYALCSLNIYLTVFYGFLYGPFSYLFLLPLVLKLPMLLLLPEGNPVKEGPGG